MRHRNPWRRRRPAVAGLVLLLSVGCVDGEAGAGEGEGGEMPETSVGPAPVWLDVDPATGLDRSEVDDGVAMIQAFHSPELEVRGISVVYGNTTLDNGVPVAQQILERFGPTSLEVLPGASSAEELGRESAATRGMAAALEEGPLRILALGPVTNVATLLALRPDLAGRIEEIVMVAARRPGQSFYPRRPDGSLRTDLPQPHRDFNFELDPRGMQLVLESGVPLVFAPWEVSSWVWILRQDLEELAATGPTGAWLAEAVQSWVGLWEESFGVAGFNPFDTLGVAWVTHPELLEGMEVAVWIEEGPDDRKPLESGVEKPYLLVDPDREEGRRAMYLYKPRPDFKPLLLERLAGPPEEES